MMRSKHSSPCMDCGLTALAALIVGTIAGGVTASSGSSSSSDSDSDSKYPSSDRFDD